MKIKRVTGSIASVLLVLVLFSVFFTGCRLPGQSGHETITVTDQLGRRVKVLKNIRKIAAFHHFGGKLVYALGRQHLLVAKSIFGREAAALKKIDNMFKVRPDLSRGSTYNTEALICLNPDVVFVYATTDQAAMEQIENAGIAVVAVRGETFEEAFEAIRLMAEVLNCRDRGEQYITHCKSLLALVEERLKKRSGKPLKALFAGPKSIYSAATGSMLQDQILELSGAGNVAHNVKGFWADVSPEQIAIWNPDVIFLGSSFNSYSTESLYQNPHFKTINAVKNRRIYEFPSNAGWWDYPAPHCVLGVVWCAKTLYPKLFSDVDVKALADEFYGKYTGYTFERLGGKL